MNGRISDHFFDHASSLVVLRTTKKAWSILYFIKSSHFNFVAIKMYVKESGQEGVVVLISEEEVEAPCPSLSSS